MHVVVSWDIKATSARTGVVDEQLRANFQGYSWVRPLPTLYVVKVKDLEERVALKDALIATVKSVPEKVHFIISPPMSGGSYTGWLPNEMWEKINKRTT